MTYLNLFKLLSPYLLIAAIVGFIYYQDLTIKKLNSQIENQTLEIQTINQNLENQKAYFEDKIKKEKFTVKYVEKKSNIEKGIKKDEIKDTNNTNRFYLN